jgi:uncharacterized pyridoxamine 5'-phosphate oxidase family protein/Pyruvate/2-oxoacid:ferredoxin oxidoreductase delta subunit
MVIEIENLEYLKYFQILFKDIHSIVLATNDENGHPATAYMDVMMADQKGIYFMTSRGKGIYQRMNTCDFVALSGMSGTNFFDSKMINIRGKIRNIGNSRVKELFDANPYMYKIYPTENGREVIDVFQIYEGTGECMDSTSGTPIRNSFSFGGAKEQNQGYVITKTCNECGKCTEKCPMNCIEKGTPYKIRIKNCLHCGNCFFSCPIKAVEKRKEK